MTDDITITAGAAQTDIEPGTYEVTLTEISEPRTFYPTTGVNANKPEGVTVRDWTFVLEDGTPVTQSATVASGPKSNTFAWISALIGSPAVVGQSYPRSQLIGRICLATIVMSERGWPKIASLSALPKARTAPAAAPAPAARRPAPISPVVPGVGASEDVPF